MKEGFLLRASGTTFTFVGGIADLDYSLP